MLSLATTSLLWRYLICPQLCLGSSPTSGLLSSLLKLSSAVYLASNLPQVGVLSFLWATGRMRVETVVTKSRLTVWDEVSPWEDPHARALERTHHEFTETFFHYWTPLHLGYQVTQAELPDGFTPEQWEAWEMTQQVPQYTTVRVYVGWSTECFSVSTFVKLTSLSCRTWTHKIHVIRIRPDPTLLFDREERWSVDDDQNVIMHLYHHPVGLEADGETIIWQRRWAYTEATYYFDRRILDNMPAPHLPSPYLEERASRLPKLQAPYNMFAKPLRATAEHIEMLFNDLVETWDNRPLTEEERWGRRLTNEERVRGGPLPGFASDNEDDQDHTGW